MPRGVAVGSHPLRSLFDRFAARGAVRQHAHALGFSRVASEELVVVASELCTNVVKYGVSGSLTIERVSEPRPGLLLCAEDHGPPFFDFARALEDGSDDRGVISPDALRGRAGIGAGLGAVRRFSDHVWQEPFDGGKRVFVVRFVERA